MQTTVKLSAACRGTLYQADTLIGGADTPEALVANFNGVDCFTLVGYVEAIVRLAVRKSWQARTILKSKLATSVADYLPA